jgi:hypothetical protein
MRKDATQSAMDGLDTAQAEEVLMGLAQVFLNHSSGFGSAPGGPRAEPEALNLEARYRTLIEQIPAVVFMVYLDRGVGEAYVNPVSSATSQCGSTKATSPRICITSPRRL